MLAGRSSFGISLGKALLRHSGRLRTVTCAASTSKNRNIELPCLVMCRSRRRFPLDSSSGTRPRRLGHLLARVKALVVADDQHEWFWSKTCSSI